MPRPVRLFSFALAFLLAFAAALQAAPSAAGARPAGGFVRILVKLRPQTTPPLVRRFGRPAPTLRALRVRVVEVPRRDVASALSRLRASGAVRYAERDRAVMSIAGAEVMQTTPSDPLWPQQWGAALTRAPTAWTVTKGAASVVVAVLDTGVDYSQPDLQGALLPGYDFVNGDSDASDDHGHGTGVAGVIAARADNGLGGVGLCPSCSILPVKVAAADGTASESKVAAGIVWAADHGARVINLSLGGSYGATVANAVAYATGKGVLVVAAAGNNGSSAPFYPAADAGVLSVAATQPDDTLYTWSNYGEWVSVAAPGCDVATMRWASYGDFCGTSASTPVVSGLAGLAFAFAPSASADTVKKAIVSTARHVDRVTYGRVDVAATLAALGAVFPAAPTAAPSPAIAPQPAAATAPRRTSRPRAAIRLARRATRFHLGARAKAARRKLRRRSHVVRPRRAVLRQWVRLEHSLRPH
jgi:thermitase